jgi:hypothetical protein
MKSCELRWDHLNRDIKKREWRRFKWLENISKSNSINRLLKLLNQQ